MPKPPLLPNGQKRNGGHADPAISVLDAQRILGLSWVAVMDLADRGVLPCLRGKDPLGRPMFLTSVVEAYRDRQEPPDA